MSVRKVGLEPGEGSASDAKGGFEACDECGMVNGVKSSTGIKKHDQTVVRG